MRVSSLVLGTDKRRHQRIVKIKNVKFLPATGTPKAAFLLPPSTKTRKSWQPVGLILRRNRNRSAKICAVQAMQRQMAIRKADGASKEDVLFANPRTGKPYSRNVFTTRLKSLVDKSAAWTVGDTYIGRPSKIILQRHLLPKSSAATAQRRGIGTDADRVLCKPQVDPGTDELRVRNVRGKGQHREGHVRRRFYLV